MPRLSVMTGLAVLVGGFAICGSPVLADCVSCGPGGDCYTVSQGFSGNCECKIRSVNGVAVCKPSGVCDPGDAGSCDEDGFPPFFSARPKISTRFLDDLAEVNPLLAGAVWAGISEANSSREGDQAEVKGTMGQDGRSFTYRVEVRLLAKGSASLKVDVQEDGVEQSQRYEGTLAGAGRSGRFVQIGSKSRSPVFSWGAR